MSHHLSPSSDDASTIQQLDRSTFDIESALSALAILTNTTFATVTEATQAYLRFIMEHVHVRTAFVAHVDNEFEQILDLRNNNGSAITASGLIQIEETFCQYVRAGGEPVVIPDTAHDPRVMNLPARTNSNIGSYVGAPLILSDGSIYGTLCALDPQARSFSQMQVDLVRIVARHVALLIERELASNIRQNVAPMTIPPEAFNEQTILLKIVAHDIRSPLSCIQGYVEMLRAGLYGPLLEEQQATLAQVHQSTRFINRLVVDLLDAAVANSGTLMLLSDVFDPNQIAHSVVESCRAQAEERGLALRFEAELGVSSMVGDADRLQQILLNFMSNALRYTPRGSITMKLSAEGDCVRFSVQDTGSGIPTNMQESIWHLHTRNSTEERGLGLGLYIVRQLAHAMNGTVGVESAPNQGSVFWISLPVEGPPPHKFPSYS